MEQRISGLRLIWPDEALQEMARDVAASVPPDASSPPPFDRRRPGPPATVFGRAARRYQHLAVIDGGRQG
jgi:hypothetical protein